MKVTGTLAALLLSLSLTSCQTMANAAAAPFNMLGRMFDAGGRTLHLNSANGREAEDQNIEAKEVHSAFAALRPATGPDMLSEQNNVAQR